MAYTYTGRDTSAYYSSPDEIVTKGNFLVEDIRSDWVNDTDEINFDAYIITILKIVKEVIDLNRNINFSTEVNGVPETVHLIATLMAYYIIKDGSDTQDTFIKNNEEIRIYSKLKMFDENIKNLFSLVPKRAKAGFNNDQIRIRALRNNVDDYETAINDVIRWR